MRDPDPGQDQKARVVDDEADVASPCFRTPADIAVAATQVARSRTPRQASNRTALRPTNVLQMLADRLFIAEVMVMLHQAVEQRLISGASHLLDRDRPQVLQYSFDLCLIQ